MFFNEGDVEEREERIAKEERVHLLHEQVLELRLRAGVLRVGQGDGHGEVNLVHGRHPQRVHDRWGQEEKRVLAVAHRELEEHDRAGLREQGA